MIGRHDENLGALIDLSQIKDGQELKRIIKDFNKLDTSVKHQLNVGFNKKFNTLADKYEKLEDVLDGNLDVLKEGYAEELTRLEERIDEHNDYSEETYLKKSDLIGIDNLSEDLRKKIYWLLANSGETSGYATDYSGELRKVRWTMYFVLFADKILYLKNVRNKSASSEKTVSWEDWYGERYELNDFSSNSVELWMFNRPAESYLPLFYLPVTDDFDKNTKYYFKSNNMYIEWNNLNYDPDTWSVDKNNLFYFDETSYENELIDLIDNNNFSKTYIFRNLGEYSDKPNVNDTDRVEPFCGKVSYNGDTGRFTFDNVAQTRYIFKLVKFEY